MVVRLTMLASALFLINFVLKLTFCSLFERVAGGFFQIRNFVPKLIMQLNNLAGIHL